MSTTPVTDTRVTVSDRPVPNQSVVAELGGTVDGSWRVLEGRAADGHVVGRERVFTDSSGHWVLPLIPNSEITPTGTTYRITEPSGQHFIIVPVAQIDADGKAIPVSAGDLYTVDPPQPVMPLPGQGPAGPPFVVKGDVANQAALPTTGMPGQGWVTSDTGHLWAWDPAVPGWVDAGQFQGTPGVGLEYQWTGDQLEVRPEGSTGAWSPSPHLTGTPGTDGTDGTGVASAAVDGAGDLTMTLTDASTLGPWHVAGEPGPPPVPILGARTVSGVASLQTVHDATLEVSATTAATVTLLGDLGTQCALVWSGAASIVNVASGQVSVSDGQTWVAHRVTSGWRLYALDAASGGGTPPAEPVTVYVVDAVPDDTANTWTWTPTAGAKMVIDGAERAGGSYSVGDVTATSTAAWEALTGYVLGAPSSVTFNFTGTVVAYETVIGEDSPSHVWMLGEPAGSTQAADTGTVGGYPMVVTGTTGLTFGAATLGTGGTAAQFTAGGDQYVRADAATSGITRATASFTAECVLKSSSSAFYPVYERGSFSIQYNGATSAKEVDAVVNTAFTSSVSVKTPAGSVPSGVTTHVALVYDHAAGMARIYLNGSLSVETACARTGGSNGYGVPAIGARDDGIFKGAEGSVAAVAIYPAALSAARILAHAQAAGLA